METPPKSAVRGILIGIVVMSIGLGVTLLQGFEYWLRSNPIYWIQFCVVAMFAVAIVITSKRLLRAIP
jgi:hypothetical protein